MILWCLTGALAGIIAGLIPGLHSNNVAIILSVSPLFGEEAMAFMLSLCITQAFTEFIPSMLIGIPSENSFESILPMHRLALEGRAFHGICLTTFGALTAVIAGSILTPIFFIFIEQNSSNIITATPAVLFFALITFIAEGKTIKQKLTVLFVIIAAGMQGLLFQNQIFPLITGYFGIAGTFYSLKDEAVKTKQFFKTEIDIGKIKEALVGMIGGAIVSIMPGIGSNTAGGIIKQFRENKNTEDYLTMLGAINASNFFFSFAMLIALFKARNGTMLALGEKIVLTHQSLFNGTIIMLFSAGIGGLASILLAEHALKLFDGKKQKTLGVASILLMIILTFVFNGTQGLLALACASALGIYVISKKIRRSTCMSSLIVPAMLFYLFILF